jgi:hypothetical protein
MAARTESTVTMEKFGDVKERTAIISALLLAQVRHKG